MDIYHYLKRDHQKVSDLMERVVSARSAERKEELLAEIREELELHADAEQATFYAALEHELESSERVEDAEDDHDEVREYLQRLSGMSAESPKWMELFGELKHAVERHVRMEEERMFAQARRIFSKEDAEGLAMDMKRLKKEAMQQQSQQSLRKTEKRESRHA